MAKLKKVQACIIGSGPGGGVVAKELAEQYVSVVVLEAGRRFNPLEDYASASYDWERIKRENYIKYKSPEMDKITLSTNNIGVPNVVYGVGGGTLRYMAEVPRMMPEDFKLYSLDGKGADWPIAYENLAPYYRRVEMELGVSGKAGDPWSPPIEPYPNPPFEFSYANKILKRGFDRLGIKLWPMPVARLSRPYDKRPVCVQCGECEHGCLSRAKSSIDVTYIPKAEATGRAEIRAESIVTQINVNKTGKAKSVVYVDNDGVEHEQEADVIIVSAGTIQSPRLLLNSKSNLFANGLSNSNGMVGKYFMQHISLNSYARFSERIDSFRGFAGGAYSRDFDRTIPTNDFVRGWDLSLHSGLRGPIDVARYIGSWGALHKKEMLEKFGHIAGILAHGSMLPDQRNRIELDPEVVDSYGMPVPRITFELRENDKKMLEAMEKQFREIYAAAGALEILEIKNWPGSSSHNMGTCRMGSDPETSVLNSFCQSHEVSNLFVVDGSCFVTCSTANPSLTIMSIATRAAEYIVEEGKKGNL